MNSGFGEKLLRRRRDSKTLVTCVFCSVEALEVVVSEIGKDHLLFSSAFTLTMIFSSRRELPLTTRRLGRPKVLKGSVIYMKYTWEA